MKPPFRHVAYGLVGACALLAGCGDKSSDALIQSARQFAAKSDFNAAIIQLKTALQKSPDAPEARFLLGSALLETGDAGVSLGRTVSSVFDLLQRTLDSGRRELQLVQSQDEIAKPRMQYEVRQLR